MVYEADRSWEGPHSRPSFFSTASDESTAAAAPALVDRRSGEHESVIHVDACPKRRRVAFDFSAFQEQHKEAAWTLATFFSAARAGSGGGGGARNLMLGANIRAWDGRR